MNKLMAEFPKVIKKNLPTILPCNLYQYVCSKDMLLKFRADLQISMKACYYSDCSCIPHNGLLGETATSILVISKVVEVKLVGEVILSL